MSKLFDRVMPVLAIAFLAFIAGSFLMFTETFPATYLANAYRGGKAMLNQQTGYQHPYMSRFYQASRDPARGVTLHDEARAQPGFTLYSSGEVQTAYLMAMNGDVLHQWHIPFSQIWNNSSPVKSPRGDDQVFLRHTHLLPNGDLLGIFEGIGDTPYGYGMVKIDKDSKVLWASLDSFHHDLDVGPDGKIYGLTHTIRTNVIEQFKHAAPPRLDDFVVVLGPDGKELKKVSIMDAVLKSPYARMLARAVWYAKDDGDYLHTNAIELIDDRKAAVFAFGKAGQVLISMRELGNGTLAVLDLDTETITWAQQGSWLGQHDPDILPNGDILLFDNAGHFSPFGSSRVMEFDPRTEAVRWSYVGSKEHPFESILRSGQERLANGNTLITESDGGRLFEVTEAGEIVWEFRNPVRGGDQGEYTPILSNAARIDPQSLDPEFLQSLSKSS